LYLNNVHIILNHVNCKVCVHKTSVTPPNVFAVPVSSHESERSCICVFMCLCIYVFVYLCICVFGLSILSLYMNLLLDFGTASDSVVFFILFLIFHDKMLLDKLYNLDKTILHGQAEVHMLWDSIFSCLCIVL